MKKTIILGVLTLTLVQTANAELVINDSSTQPPTYNIQPTHTHNSSSHTHNETPHTHTHDSSTHMHEHDEVPNFARSATQMTVAAQALINSLSDDQKASVIYDFNDDNARTYWTNAPTDSQSRNGLPIGRFSIEQRELLHNLLKASTSSQGYYKIWAAVQGDDELKREGENRELDSDKFFTKNRSLGAIGYYVSFYGDPTTDSKWGYMITGHHLAANFTVIDGQTTFVPMFYGSDPATISQGQHAGYTFLPQERNRGWELFNSLNAEQQQKALINIEYPSNRFGPIDFKGPGKKDVPIENRGIRGDELTDAQQRLLWVLIEEYVGNADFDIAEAWIEKIKQDGINNLYFMWMGPTDGSEKIFFRVNGPSILIDFADQRTGFDWNTHPHTIVRDPSNDYGEDWLQRHIEEFHK
ncbi:DUF3500 domain-containing protein [Psychrobacter sp. FDAARGOS_221]|uniref:DUF3500 domain-containing protein n=1 Tax=Psychrobacter sp. FDAARGOS_221 TaxID=1975705 RepID=UPI000BB53F56|nr:DUF3500 domain-containing protein [Psychrobacter sp. FDAARGOS_221]PNK61516.1 DUF3500 domain-containing protein [Psychrobacter sp. FDAARGOS_221]